MYDRVRESVPEGVKVILFGQKQYDHDPADAVIGNVQMGMSGLTFELSYRGRTDTIHTNLVGKFNAENITAAALAALELGVDIDTVKSSVKELFIPGRLNFVEANGRHVIIDYAHNHMSYSSLFRTIRSIYPTDRLTALVGAMGDKAFGRRREAGQMTNVYADRVVITEQDSGSEHPAKIGSEIARYVHKLCKIVPRREAAIRYILDKSDPGDVIVLTGKGAEKTLRVGRNSVRPYAGDLEIVKAWLRTDMTIDAK
ncbi:Mur ligase family, glutamate ligase domain protein [Coprococcus eutactus ATCC 27759]|nr:Mur ligase family, glutamate ligase domain protein [Coprococcus eutactus ATCC 27759]